MFYQTEIILSSHQMQAQMFCKIVAFENFSICAGKQLLESILQACNFIEKYPSAGLFL